jgi:DNA polymerase-3 subunit chi
LTEVLFYHLQRQPLEHVLPTLLERSLARGWRVVVEAGSEERVEALDAHLWTYAEVSFLPHGSAKDGDLDRQPIALVTGSSNPNAAAVRFFVDGALPDEVEGYDRVVLLFDGNDEDAVEAARVRWKALKAAGHDLTYWQQSDEGRWEKKA